MSLRQLLNYVYVWARNRVDPEGLDDWLEELNRPDVASFSSRRVTPSTIEDEMAVFAAAK